MSLTFSLLPVNLPNSLCLGYASRLTPIPTIRLKQSMLLLGKKQAHCSGVSTLQAPCFVPCVTRLSRLAIRGRQNTCSAWLIPFRVEYESVRVCLPSASSVAPEAKYVFFLRVAKAEGTSCEQETLFCQSRFQWLIIIFLLAIIFSYRSAE